MIEVGYTGTNQKFFSEDSDSLKLSIELIRYLRLGSLSRLDSDRSSVFTCFCLWPAGWSSTASSRAGFT